MADFWALFNTVTDIFSPPDDYTKQSRDGSVEHAGDFAKTIRTSVNYRLANSDFAPAVATAHVSGVIGEGVNVQARFDDNNLNEAFEAYLRKHSRPEFFDITGRFHFNEALRQMQWFRFVNGGVIVRFHYNDEWEIPLRLELIGVDMIDTSKNDDRTRNGIQKDRYGRITYLWLYTSSKKQKSRRVSMRNLYYYMQPWLSLSQYTAVSRMASILPRLGKYDKYLEAEVQSAINKAKTGVFWATTLYAPIMKRLDELLKQSSTQDAAKEARDLIDEMAKRGVGATGATPIPDGDTIHKVTSNNDSVFDTISDTSLKSMSAALGESITTSQRDISQGNYASLKMDAVLASRLHKVDFDNLKQFINVYLERLLEIGVRMGDLPIRRQDFYSNKYDYFGRWEIMRRVDDSVDEVKQATARKVNLATNSTTLGRIYSEQGLDYEQEMKKAIELEIKVELMRRRMYEEAGLEVPVNEN